MVQISLRLPFAGDFPVSFPFGREARDPVIDEKFKQWDIIGHHGVDIALPEGTPVLSAADGIVEQSGTNGDWGISVTLRHTWGISIYAHLKETPVVIGQKITQGNVIGFSGSTGAAYGSHLHFGIKPNNADVGNGYLGFIDPTPYLTQEAIPTPITSREIPVGELIDTITKKRLSELRLKANEARKKRREKKLTQIIQLATHKHVTNLSVRDTLHVSRAASANYLNILKKQGKLTKHGRGRTTSYISN